MKIIFFALEDWQKEYIQNNDILKKVNIEVMFVEHPLTRDHIPHQTDAEMISVFVNSNVDKEVLNAFPQLRFIATRSTGFDHIDLKECAKRDILVSNVPSYGANTVAEYTFALILTLSRKIYQSYNQVRETGSFQLRGLRGFDLKGKTLGVIGTGKIGRNVVKIGKAFEMNVIACDTNPDEEFAKEMGFEYCEPEKALEEGDIVTLHVPYNKDTHHLINKNNIQRMKKGAFLINTSRGGVVETAALIKALKDGHLGGAALDVLEEEGVIKDELEFLVEGRLEDHNLQTVLANHVLIDMPNVIVTPHNAFNTWGALERILDTTAENVKGFIEGKPENLAE